MSRRSAALGIFIGAIGLIAVCGAAWFILPDPVGLIPVQIRLRLPQAVVDVITTPIPTALPAPLTSASHSDASLLIPVSATDTPSPTASSTSTSLPTTMAALSDSSPAVMGPTVAASSTKEPTATPTASPTPTPTVIPAAFIKGFEIVAQEFNNCGPANLTMVLNYFGQKVTQYDVGDDLKPSYDDRNVSPDELVGFVRENTALDALAFCGGDIDLLKQLLAAGYPVIIEKGFMPHESLGWMGHYLTLVGYDESEQSLVAMDSYLGPWDDSGRYENYEAVSELWEHFNNTFIVVFREDQRDSLMEMLGSSFENPETMWQHSVEWAQERIEENPANAYAWFNVGTNLTELGELTGRKEYFENAAIAFDKAREIGLPWRMLWYQFKPYTAYLESGRIDEVLALTLHAQSIEETHLYRGHALRANGDYRGAAYAYRQALRMNPHFEEAALALSSLPES